MTGAALLDRSAHLGELVIDQRSQDAECFDLAGIISDQAGPAIDGLAQAGDGGIVKQKVFVAAGEKITALTAFRPQQLGLGHL